MIEIEKNKQGRKIRFSVPLDQIKRASGGNLITKGLVSNSDVIIIIIISSSFLCRFFFLVRTPQKRDQIRTPITDIRLNYDKNMIAQFSYDFCLWF